MRAIGQLDDGKSDPTSIAYGLAPKCAALYQQFTQAMVSDNITDKGHAAARDRAQAGELQLITTAILTYRKAHPRGANSATEPQ